MFCAPLFEQPLGLGANDWDQHLFYYGVGAEEHRRVRADAVLESLVLRRQRDVAEPADRDAQPGVSADRDACRCSWR